MTGPLFCIIFSTFNAGLLDFAGAQLIGNERVVIPKPLCSGMMWYRLGQAERQNWVGDSWARFYDIAVP